MLYPNLCKRLIYIYILLKILLSEALKRTKIKNAKKFLKL